VSDILIGLSGRAGSGKDTVADYLASDYGFSRFQLATPIKSHLHAVVGLSDAQLDGDLKEVVLPELGKSPRAMMQDCGDYFRRYFGEDVLLSLLSRQLEHAQSCFASSCLRFGNLGGPQFNVVVSDVRLNNEADWIRVRGGTVLHVVRDDVRAVREHVTEAGVALHRDDLQIVNNGSIDDLLRKIDTIVLEVLGGERDDSLNDGVDEHAVALGEV